MSQHDERETGTGGPTSSDPERDSLLQGTDEVGRHWRSWETRPLTVGQRVRYADHVKRHPADAPRPHGQVARIPVDGIPYGSGAFAVCVLWDGATSSVTVGPADLVAD